MKETITKILDNKDLTKNEAYGVMKTIMSGGATPSQIAGFLIALRCKGESAQEIAGCALAMRDAANPIHTKHSLLVDNCGTGGDGKQGLNISTAAAFVVAGAGYAVAKHGNRSISSKCGSADVLEALGVKIDGPPVSIERSLDDAGIGFMFAPNFHPAMKYAMPTRKELAVRTVFNILGPLSNPAKAQVQLIGVYSPKLTKVLAQVLSQMGHKGGLVVHSKGWDEITLAGPTEVAETLNKKIRTYKLAPKDFGLSKVAEKECKGGSAKENADRILDILSGGKDKAAPVVVANAAALIWITERAKGQKNFKLKEAVKKAQESISSGKAADKVRKMSSASNLIY